MKTCPEAATDTGTSQSLENSPEVLTVCEAARLLRLGVNTTYDAIHRGQLPTVRIGRRLLVPRAALKRLLYQETAPQDALPAPRDKP